MDKGYNKSVLAKYPLPAAVHLEEVEAVQSCLWVRAQALKQVQVGNVQGGHQEIA